jgi:hypothetical protein
VAAIALGALGRRHLVVPGMLNRITRFVMYRLAPRHAAVALTGKSTERMYGG